MKKQEEREPYQLQLDPRRKGCSQCGSGREWQIIGPAGVQLAQTYSDKSDASWLALQLNDAYRLGKEVPPSPARLYRMEGAVECLKELLDHCQGNLIEVDEKQVMGFLHNTEKELKKKLKLWERGKDPDEPLRLAGEARVLEELLAQHQITIPYDAVKRKLKKVRKALQEEEKR